MPTSPTISGPPTSGPAAGPAGPGTTGTIVTAPVPQGPPEAAPPAVAPGAGTGQITQAAATPTPPVIELPVDTAGAGGVANTVVIGTVPNYIEVLANGEIIIQNATAMNFTGNGVVVTANGAVATIAITSSPASTYGDANVSALLANFGANTILTSGNITGGYFVGNGSQLTGLYGNANVAANLAAFGSNPISTSGNITGGNIGTGVITLTNSSIIKDTAGNAVTFGRSAGQNPQGINAVAVGNAAGNYLQGSSAVAVGDRSGGYTQGISAVAVGQFAGNYLQGNSAVAIGNSAGLTGQGLSAVAIGAGAGATNQGNNSIIINATAANLEQTTANTFTVAPVRNDVANTANVMFYNATSKEITYGNAISVTGNITGGNVLFGSGIVSGTGNITGGNILTGGLISATGNVSGGNIRTAGSISATGNITVSTSGSVGIGTATPDAELTILGNPQTVVYPVTGNSTTLGTDLHMSGADGSNTRIVQDAYGTGSYSAFTGRTARGTAAAPTQTQTGDALTQFTARGFSNGTLQFGNTSTGRVDIVAAEAFTDTSRATNVQILTTATSSITPTVVATFSSASGLSVTGNIAGSNIVTAGLISATANITGGNVLTGGLISATGNITGGNLIATANIVGNTAGYTIGYLNIPQVSLAANSTIALTDAGKHYYTTGSSNLALTIANNTSVSWAVGTAITVVNGGTANILINQGTGVSMYLAGNSTAANRVLATYGMATIMNTAANVWFINGTGLT